MKNISLSLTALVLSLASVNNSNAQSNALYASSVVVMNNNNTGNTGAENGGIDARALKNFKKDFSSVSDAQWEQKADGYETKFKQKDIQFHIGYNTKGDWQYTERTYGASNLPVDIKHNIESVYLYYSIDAVQEITTRQNKVYIVNISNKDWSMKIKVDASDIESIEEYKK